MPRRLWKVVASRLTCFGADEHLCTCSVLTSTQIDCFLTWAWTWMSYLSSAARGMDSGGER